MSLFFGHTAYEAIIVTSVTERGWGWSSTGAEFLYIIKGKQ